MQIDQKYKHLIHQNATALLRPRTGLKDMFIELNPGTASAPAAKPGFTIPVVEHERRTSTPTRSCPRWTPTRAQYLQLLVNGAGDGPEGQRRQRARRSARALRADPPRPRPPQLRGRRTRSGSPAAGQLAAAAEHVACDQAVSDRHARQLELARVPRVRVRGRQHQPRRRRPAGDAQPDDGDARKVQAFAEQLGPAATNLLPAAQALPAANQRARRSLAESRATADRPRTRSARSSIAARPVVRNLRPAAINLAKATPKLSNVFVTLNHFVNMVGYNPGDAEHGYLWWLAWLNHNARTLFSIQDANGDFRPLFLQASCATLRPARQRHPGRRRRSEPDPDPDQRRPVPAAEPGGRRRVPQVPGRTRERPAHAATRALGAISATRSSASTGARNPLFLPKLPTK